MGTPGPPGAYDPHKYFRGSPQGPYPPQTSGYQPSSPGNSFHHQPSHSYPPGSMPPGSFSPNTSMYPGSPVLNNPYSTTQFPQAGTSVYHGPQYGHYNQDHSPRQDPHLASQFSQQSTQPPSSSHSNQSRIPISSTPPPIYPQFRSSLPMPSLSPALPLGTYSFNPVSSEPLDGARLMALLTTQSEGEGMDAYEETVCLPGASQSSSLPPLFSFRHMPVDPSHSIGTEMPGTPPPMSPSFAHSVQGRQAPRVQRGRHLGGDYVTYDVDARKAGDAPSELVVNPITLYNSETALVLGRQIAVNKKFVCYGLREGQIRILNINSSQRILLRGHTQRVTDMAFFSDDVPMLASASQDGRIYIRKIVENHEENGKLTDQILLALQFLGNWEKCHPRLCWHSQKQDLLAVAIGKFVFLIHIYQVATPGGSNVDVPVECRIENPVRGVYVIGQHDDDVTELASCASVATSLATASKDGTVRLWGGGKQSPQSAIAPFGGLFVDAVAFLPSPRGTDGHVLLTGGPLNRELKLWALDDQSVQSGHAVWRCIQTLEFQSITKPDIAFFNHVVVSSRANLIFLANAKRNAIYVAHVNFSSPSGGPRIDYVTEHSVSMPILSFTVADDGVSESGEGVLKIFCVQTHGIYQYALDMSQCLPNLLDGDGSTSNTPKKSFGIMPVAPTRPRRPFRNLRSTAMGSVFTAPHRFKAEKMEGTKETLLDTEASADTTQSSLNSNSVEYESGEQEDKDGISSTGTGNSVVPQQQMGPQLLSPSDIMSMAAGSKRDDAPPQETGYDLMDVLIAKTRQDDARVGTLPWPSDELAPDPEGTGDFSIPQFDSPDGQGGAATECFEKEITTEGDNGSATINWEGRGTGDEAQVGDLTEDKERPTPDDLQDQLINMALKLDRQAGNAAAGSNSTQGPMNLIAQVESLQESIFQLIEMQMELQKQIITTVATPVIKEGNRLEGVLGQRLEKLMKANADSMWVKLSEENAEREKQDCERILRITSLFNDFSAKDFPAALELGLKKEVAAIGANIAHTLVVPVQTAVSAVLAECFQKNLTEKMMPLMEKTVVSKLEAIMTKQLKIQFQTSGKQALQDGIRASFETLIIPGFERSCQTMFDQVNTVFQMEMVEHSSQIQRELSSSHTAVATNLQDLIAGASSLAKDLNGELDQSMTKLLRLVKTADSTGEVNQHKDILPDKVHSLRRVGESLDPTIELTRLLHAGLLEEAFNKALKANDLQIVYWLCHQLEPVPLLSADPLPVSQGVLLSLMQQLSSDLSRDTGHKLGWIKEATLALNPSDPVIGPHVHSFLELAFQNCQRQMSVSKDPSEQVTLRLVMHVINSFLKPLIAGAYTSRGVLGPNDREDAHQDEDADQEENRFLMNRLQKELMEMDNICEVSSNHETLSSLLRGEAGAVLFCCYDTKENQFEFYFKNSQDMASIVGVGLLYAKAILDKGWRIKVKEISKTEWEQTLSLVQSNATNNPMFKSLKLELSRSGIIGGDIYFKGRPLLWDLAKYFMLKEIVTLFANHTDGASSSNQPNPNENSSSSNNIDPSVCLSFCKMLLLERYRGRGDDEDGKNREPEGEPPVRDHPGALNGNLDTIVAIELLKGGEILNLTREVLNSRKAKEVVRSKDFDDKTKAKVKVLDGSILPNLEFEFRNHDGVKTIRSTIGQILFNLDEEERWLHCQLKVYFGLHGGNEQYGEVVRNSFKHLDLHSESGETSSKSTRTLGNSQGNGSTTTWSAFLRPKGIGGSLIHATRTSDDYSDSRQFESSDGRKLNHTIGGMIPKKFQYDRKIGCHYTSLNSRAFEEPDVNHPSRCAQEVQFEAIWRMIAFHPYPRPTHLVEYELMASRSLERLPLDESDGKLKDTKFVQEYKKKILLNHEMTHLDGQHHKLFELPRQFGGTYLAREGKRDEYIWCDRNGGGIYPLAELPRLSNAGTRDH